MLLAVAYLNVAINQTAYLNPSQASTRLATDGVSASCASTALSSGSNDTCWLAVDLGVPFNVYGIIVTGLESFLGKSIERVETLKLKRRPADVLRSRRSFLLPDLFRFCVIETLNIRSHGDSPFSSRAVRQRREKRRDEESQTAVAFLEVASQFHKVS
jgi:hypothetical protein